MNPSIRLYQPRDEEKILELHRLVFADAPLDSATWEWKYRRNPTRLQWIACAFSDDGTLIAHFAAVPVVGVVRGRRKIIAQATDVMVHPGYRAAMLGRDNVFSRTAQLLIGRFEDESAIGYGFPEPRHLRLGKILLGYTPLFKVPRHEFDLTSWNVERPHSLRERLFIKKVNGFTSGADRLWDSVEEEHGFAVVRSSSYLNWRYRDRPGGDYHIWVLSGPLGRWKAWIVLSVHEQKARLVDLLVPSYIPAGSRELICTALDFAATEGAEIVETWIPSCSTAAPLLASLGFHEKPEKHSLHATVRIHEPEIAANDLAEKFYFQMGCSDMY